MTQPDLEKSPPSFVERLDLILWQIWCFLLASPILYLLAFGVCKRLKVQVQLPAGEEWISIRFGIVILAIGGVFLHGIFSSIIFLITGKKTSSFDSKEKNDTMAAATIAAIISALIIFLL